MTLEQEIKDFIDRDFDYFQKPVYEEREYWHLFNLCTKEEENIVLQELKKIRASIVIIQNIEEDCYGR